MFSNSTKYAIRASIFLARNKDQKKFKASEISDELGIPSSYLGKILQQLAKNRIISSTKGPGGGFYVDDRNMNCRLIDVIMCMEGPLALKSCVLGLNECSEKNPCYLHNEYVKIKQILDRPLYQNDFSDLIGKTGS